MKDLLKLYLLFIRLGMMAFGGGYSVVPIYKRELIDKRGWITEEELLDYFAIGQCTPGLIAVNTATFIGNKRHKGIGGVIATLGFITPPVVIILLIAGVLHDYFGNPWVAKAFAGIRVAVLVMIFQTVIDMWKKSVVDITTFIIFAIVSLLSLFTKISPVWFVMGSAVLGIALGGRFFKKRGILGSKNSNDDSSNGNSVDGNSMHDDSFSDKS